MLIPAASWICIFNYSDASLAKLTVVPEDEASFHKEGRKEREITTHFQPQRLKVEKSAYDCKQDLDTKRCD